MPIEFTVFLILIGLACGLVSTQIRVSPALTCLTALYFFLPVIGMPVDQYISIVIATILVACLPIHLYHWLTAMKAGRVEYSLLLKYAPGLAMGGVIGAQLVSLSNVEVLLAFISFTLLLNIFVSVLEWQVHQQRSVPNFPLPIGLLAGGMSVLGANDGHTVARLLYQLHPHSNENRDGTLHGMSVFLSFSALIGFVFPALQPVAISHIVASDAWLAGAIYIPAALALGAGLLFGSLLTRWQVSHYEHKILLACFNLYLIVCLFRIWQ